MTGKPTLENHEVRAHSTFREHQNALNSAWKDYLAAAWNHGVDSGEARAAELNLRQVRWRMRMSVQRP